jgi:hypothetical protein
MKSQEIVVTTSSDVDRIKGCLSEVFRGATIEPLQSSTGGLLDSGPVAAVELLAEKKTIGGIWAVQVFVFDQGHQRQVKFIALGDSGASRAFHGIKNTASLSKSVKIAEQAAAALR